MGTLDQSPHVRFRFSEQPSSLNDQEGGADQLIGQRPGGGEIGGERELAGDALGDAMREAFFRLLNQRSAAERHEGDRG